MFFLEVNSILLLNLSPRLVNLISHQEDDCALLQQLLLNFRQPPLHIGKGFVPSDIKGEKNDMSAPIEDFCDAFEILLASCIPNLNFVGFLILKLDDETAEFYANGDLVVFHKVIGCYSLHQRRLSNCRVTNEDQLKREIGPCCLV